MSTTKKRAPAKVRKARKAKLIEIDGHLLTPELHDEYQRCLESRQQRNPGAAWWEVEKLALSDVLAKVRFSLRTKELFPALYRQLVSVATGVAAFDDYPFYDSYAPHVRLAGCDTLNRLAAEAQLLGAKIHAIGEAIRYEEREKLQDWQRRQAAYDASSAHGLAPTVPR
jgi:hypothetical protein